MEEYKIGPVVITCIRNFQEQDARRLQQIKYQDKSIEEVKGIIALWNSYNKT